MANTKIQNLPTASLAQLTRSNSFYLYMADLNTSRDVKFNARDLFTNIRSIGSGVTLIANSSPSNVTLKSFKTTGTILTSNDAGSEVNISFNESAVDLHNCSNTNSKFLQSVDLGTDVGTTTLAIVNGGTGATEQSDGLNLITNSASGIANQILKTDGTSASWSGVNSLITAGVGLAWDVSTTPYALKADFSSVTFDTDVVINNNVNISGAYNFSVSAGWISNDGTNEGINIDSTGRVFMGPSVPTAVFNSTGDAALTLGDNLSFISGATRAINMVSPSAGAGDEFQILGSAPSASNQAGGAVTFKGGVGSGSGAGGAVNLYAGDSTSGDGDINMYITDAGTVAQVMKIHGSNKHFTIGSTGANNGAVLDVQNDTAGAACLELDQNDTDEPFIIYTGTTAADSSASLSSLHGTFPNHTNANDGWVRVNINGTDKWVPFFATPA